MKLQLLYNQYLNIKFNRGLPPVPTDGFEYGFCEDDSAQLFFVNRKSESFIEWAYDLQPRDLNYIVNPDWQPVLADYFPQLDVYDEQILYYLLYTINSPLFPYAASK